MTRRSPGRMSFPTLFLFAVAVTLGNSLDQFLRYPDIGAAVFFPPYAILTAALLVADRRDRIWYIFVASLAHLITHWPEWPLSWVVFADVANIARALTAVALLGRLFGGPVRFDSVSALAAFLFSAVLVAPAVGATIGAANVTLHGASNSYWRPWSAWFVSNALTGLTMLPACTIAFGHGVRRVHTERRHILEAGLLAVLLAATCSLMISGGPDRQHATLPLYAPIPVVIWAALRFGSGGASLALTIVGLAAIWSVDSGNRLFLAQSADENIFAVQMFLLFTALPMLCLVAIVTSREKVSKLHAALLASVQDQIMMLDGDGIVLEVNGSWQRAAATADAPGFQAAGAGDDFLAVCRRLAQRHDSTAAAIHAGVSSVLARAERRFEIEYDLNRLGRRESYVMTVEALERSDGGAVLTLSNVTVSRQLQRDIEERRQEVSHLARVAVLGQLSGAIAHELNQPLTAIRSNAEAAQQLLERRPTDTEQLVAIMRDIVDDDERATEVIQRLRALLRRGDRRVQVIEPPELIGEVLALARTELITRGIRAASEIEANLPPLRADRIQLQQVLLNLVLNGCEAMSATPHAARQIVVSVTADADSVHFGVRDFGSGIPAGLADHLFEPFVTTKPDGLGLGLSISRTIVAAHGGRLWAENHREGGAMIHCLLPATRRLSQVAADGSAVAPGRQR